MEVGSVLDFLQNKTILIIGATGFIAKSIISLSLSLFHRVMCALFCYICDVFGFCMFFSFSGEDIEGSTQC